MSEHYDEEAARRVRAGLILRGSTYDHREEIKAAGGIWSPSLKDWLVKDEAICHQLGAQYSNSRKSPGWWLRTFKRRRRRTPQHRTNHTHA